MYSCNRLVFFQAWTTNVLHGRSCNYFVAFRPDVFQILVSWDEKISATFAGTLTLENTAALTTRAVQHCTWVEACCYINEGQQCIYQQQTRLLIAQVYHRQLKLYCRLKTMSEGLHGHLIRRSLWPLHSPDLTCCDFYLWGSLKDIVYKTNPHNLEQLKNNCREISTISGQEFQGVNKVFRRYSDWIRSAGQHFQHLM